MKMKINVLLMLLLLFVLAQCQHNTTNETNYHYYNVEMVLGLDNIAMNKDLNKKDQDGVKIIDKLYKYVNPTYNNGYIDRFKKQQSVVKQSKGIDIDYGVIYLKNENNEVVSMIAGPIDIEKGRFTVLNSATMEGYRGKGLLKILLKGAILRLYENNFKLIDIYLGIEIKQIDEIVINKDLKKDIVIKKFNKVVGKNLAKQIINSIKLNAKNLSLIDKVANEIEKDIIEKKQNNRTDNFAVFNNITKDFFFSVNIDDKDNRFDYLYIKPWLQLNNDNVCKVLKVQTSNGL